MEDQSKEIAQLINDFHYLKNAVMKTNKVFKFISSNTFRPLYLSTGLVTIAFTATIQFLIGHYGSYSNVPGAIKAIYYGCLAILIIWLGYSKLKMFTGQIKELGSNLTVGQLFKEIYTWNTIILVVPYFLVMALTVVFLVLKGLNSYVVPSLAILYGLLMISMTNFVCLQEYVVGGFWFIITGFGILFILGPSHSLIGLTITFGLGFIVMYIASLISTKGEPK